MHTISQKLALSIQFVAAVVVSALRKDQKKDDSIICGRLLFEIN